MAASNLSTGRMISYAFDMSQRAAAGGASGPAAATGSAASNGSAPAENGQGKRTKREEMARYLLEYLLRDPKARKAFCQVIAGIDAPATAFRTSSRSGSDLFDLEAPLTSGAEDRIAIKVIVDGTIEADAVNAALAALPTPASRLVLLLPKHRKSSLDVKDEHLIRTTWAALAKRLVKKDSKRADFWRLIGEFGEDAPATSVYRAVSPRILLDQDVVKEFRSHLDTLRLVAAELYGRPVRFSTSRRSRGAWLQVGASGTGLGVEFDAVEEGSPVWLVGTRPHRSHPLNIGALPDEESRGRAERRLRGIASGERRHDDPTYAPSVPEFIGEPASHAMEEARALLWDVFDPQMLAAAGFPLVPRRQPDLEPDALAVRLHREGDPRAGTFLVSVGRSKNWKTLLPRVTREFDGRTYIIQAAKGDTAEDLVTAVHGALLSLATKP